MQNQSVPQLVRADHGMEKALSAAADVLTRHLLLTPECPVVQHHAYQLGNPVLHRNN
jgi:hypothetical protein